MKRLHLLLILAILIPFGCAKNLDENSVRATAQGEVIGFKEGETYAWRGVPFAKPPINELRWKAPRPPELFESRFEAKEFSEECFQPQGIMTGEEGGWTGS